MPGTPETLADLYARLHATGLVTRLLELARDEDLGPQGRDVTSEALGVAGGERRLRMRAREGGVVAGLAVMPELLSVFGGGATVRATVEEGARVRPGDVVATLAGPAAAVLRAERTMLNLLGRLSGVATLAAEFAALAAPARVYDTRKTTPGLRVLEKYAVRCGGGHGHRLGLYDAVLIKDNHLAGVTEAEAGSLVREIAERARAASPDGLLFVEAEVDTLGQLASVLEHAGGVVDIVLLDNMRPATLREAVAMRDASGAAVELEASGGIRLETVAEVAMTGVERISTGAMTSAARTLDFGLDAL